jgi:hypothetical protein
MIINKKIINHKYSTFRDDMKLSYLTSLDHTIRHPLELMCCKADICTDCIQNHINAKSGYPECPFCKKSHIQSKKRFIIFDERSDAKRKLDPDPYPKTAIKKVWKNRREGQTDDEEEDNADADDDAEDDKNKDDSDDSDDSDAESEAPRSSYYNAISRIRHHMINVIRNIGHQLISGKNDINKNDKDDIDDIDDDADDDADDADDAIYDLVESKDIKDNKRDKRYKRDSIPDELDIDKKIMDDEIMNAIIQESLKTY